MIRRRLWTSLVGIVLVTVALLVVNLATRKGPALGLDLRGGLSVELAPSERAADSDLVAIRDLLRDDLERRTIAEADVRVEGQRVVIDLPGVSDRPATLRTLGSAGMVTIRPQLSGCAEPVVDEPVESSVPPSTEPASTEPASTDAGPAGFRASAAASTAPTSEPESTPPTSEPEPTTTTTTTTAPPLGPIGPGTYEQGDPSPFTPPPSDESDTGGPMRDRNGLECQVGPASRGPAGELTNFLFSPGSATPREVEGQWVIDVELAESGRSAFTSLANTCASGDPSCAAGQIALVVDDVVEGVAVSNATTGGAIIVGPYTEDEATELAGVINRGAFPVDVRVADARAVAPTLGSDTLELVVVAGLVGVALAAALLGYLYRRLVAVVVAGLAVWGLLLYSAATFVSRTSSYAITLAGVAGIAVALGVGIDSYVVYFERIKEEVRRGRSVRNVAARSFKGAWRTVLAADLVLLLAAIVLFPLGSGALRTFALYLGIATVCDLAVLLFFTRPAVGLLADDGRLDEGDTFGLKEYA